MTTQIGSKRTPQTKLFHGLASSGAPAIFAVPLRLDRTNGEALYQVDFDAYNRNDPRTGPYRDFGCITSNPSVMR